MIHSADPRSLSVVIIIFKHDVCPSVCAHFSKSKAKTIFTTGQTVGQAEWIIDDTCLVLYIFKLD